MSKITKTEREELRRIVTRQYKVLRAEVDQRKAELLVEVETAIGHRYRDRDETYARAREEVERIAREANAAISKALRDARDPAGNVVPLRDDVFTSGGVFVTIHVPDIDMRDRHNERRVAQANVEAMVKGALLRLDREEADLHRTLAIGALESDEARAFLTSIPTVGELVSMARLAQLQQAIESED